MSCADLFTYKGLQVFPKGPDSHHKPLNLLRLVFFLHWHDWITCGGSSCGTMDVLLFSICNWSNFVSIPHYIVPELNESNHNALSSWRRSLLLGLPLAGIICIICSHILFLIVPQNLARTVEPLCWWRYREPMKMLLNCCWREEPRLTLQIMPRSKCRIAKCDY